MKTRLASTRYILSSLGCVLIIVQYSLIFALKVRVSIPELVRLNDAFWLNCTDDYSNPANQVANEARNAAARGNEIYAVKWFKDDEEFYRYLPNAQPKISVYETNGVQIDQSKSSEGNVFLTKADVNTEGNYRCEILSEAPLFETVRKSKHLKVYAPPVRGPRIEILDRNGKPKSPKAQEISYGVGDKIELRCNSAPSKPAARLRWYINDHELVIPANKSADGSSNNLSPERRRRRFASTNNHPSYDANVTPIEYRLHFKGIYSSHSKLELILQQDDLINNKISFKCLASMRQDVPVRGKQLIVLTPQSSGTGELSSRGARHLSELVESSAALGADVGTYRQRPQQLRHSASRLGSTTSSSHRPQPLQSSEILKGLSSDSKSQLLYIYEDADSTLGPSIIDTPENLASFLRLSANNNGGQQQQFSTNSNSNNYALEYNKGDNLDYIQTLRDRNPRRGSFAGHANSQHASNSLKKQHGPNSLVKSPLYLDESDSLRPIISWPPLNSGKLILLPAGNNIVAIPTSNGQIGAHSSQALESRLVVVPSRMVDESDTLDSSSRFAGTTLSLDDNDRLQQYMLEHLMRNVNCTCTEGSIDTKLTWLINDLPLSLRDTRPYPTRISPDHRQTWITIGLNTGQLGLTSMRSPSSPSTPGITLQSILALYSSRESSNPSSSRDRSTGLGPKLVDIGSNVGSGSGLPQQANFKLVCQAIHSLLLYSSSETITFDFNPPQSNAIDSNSVDKLSALSSNVIQASSASQSRSSSAHGLYSNSGSQITLMLTVISLYQIVQILSRPNNRM